MDELMSNDPFKPSTALLCKLGSIAFHAKELFSPEGHAFDKISLDNLLQDPEVIEWIKAMDKHALLPKKR